MLRVLIAFLTLFSGKVLNEMKTSLKKLQKFASHRKDRKAIKKHDSASLDEHARATQVTFVLVLGLIKNRADEFRSFVFVSNYRINVRYLVGISGGWGFRKYVSWSRNM